MVFAKPECRSWGLVLVLLLVLVLEHSAYLAVMFREKPNNSFDEQNGFVSSQDAQKRVPTER